MTGSAWIVRAPDAPYFMTEHGEAWTPIGQNDSVAWFEFNGLYRRRDLPAVERHLRWLADHGVTVLFALCGEIGLRILLTPLDTFFTWNRWRKHPWNTKNGGPCPSRTKLLTHPGARAAMKARLAFATERWGAGGTLFAWDIYNEMHPAQC